MTGGAGRSRRPDQDPELYDTAGRSKNYVHRWRRQGEDAIVARALELAAQAPPLSPEKKTDLRLILTSEQAAKERRGWHEVSSAARIANNKRAKARKDQ